MELKTFNRRVGAGTNPLLGSDSAPTQPLYLNAVPENVIRANKAQVEGAPIQRLMVAYRYTGLGVAPTIGVDAYQYDYTSKTWFQIDARVTLTSGHVGYIDVDSPYYPPNESCTDARTGTIDVMLVPIAAGGEPDGDYFFGGAFDASCDQSTATSMEGILTSILTKLGDGTQKAIVRGGAKGTTAAADVTSRSVGTNAQALDVYNTAPGCLPGNYSTSRGDASAVRASDVTVTFTGPTVTSSQLRRVIAFVDGATKPNVWEQGVNAVLSISGATITVLAIDGNAAPVPATTTLVVVDWVAQDKAYDQSLQALRNAPLYDVRSFRITDLVPLLAANQTVTNAWADLGPEILVDGATDFRGYFGYTKGDGNVTTLQVRAVIKHTAGGTAEYPLPVLKTDISAVPYTVTADDEAVYVSPVDASGLRTLLWGLANTVKYVQLQVKATTPGTTMVMTAADTGYSMGYGG